MRQKLELRCTSMLAVFSLDAFALLQRVSTQRERTVISVGTAAKIGKG